MPQLGSSVPLFVLTVDATHLPVAPDACPVAVIRDDDGDVVEAITLPILDPDATVGLFCGWLYLGDSYSAGRYTVQYQWDLSQVRHEALDSFEVLPGGSPTGQVLAMMHFEKPQASYLVQQRTSGRIYKGKNPRL